jgi:hypothetical protein
MEVTPRVEAPRPRPADPTAPPAPTGSSGRRRRPVLLLLAAVLAGGVAGGATGWIAGSRSVSSDTAAAPAAEAPAADAGSDPIRSLPALMTTIAESAVSIATAAASSTGTATVQNVGFATPITTAGRAT